MNVVKHRGYTIEINNNYSLWGSREDEFTVYTSEPLGLNRFSSLADAVLFIDLIKTEEAEVARQQSTGMRAP